ncbi:hypothetical protein LSP03_37870 [Lysinibacillus sphaericus]|nr:hypothetical protein LSP03_37870 [Lysinibacillus sphaericus]
MSVIGHVNFFNTGNKLILSFLESFKFCLIFNIVFGITYQLKTKINPIKVFSITFIEDEITLSLSPNSGSVEFFGSD